MKKPVLIGTLIIASLLSGCGLSNEGNGAILGTVTGGLAGSLVGKGNGKAAAVGIGAVLGAVIGSNIGSKMDHEDRHMAESAANKAAYAPVGHEIQWENSGTGNSGSAKTIKVGSDAQGHECRQIEQQVTIEGKTDVILVDICLIDQHWVVAS